MVERELPGGIRDVSFRRLYLVEIKFPIIMLFFYMTRNDTNIYDASGT